MSNVYAFGKRQKESLNDDWQVIDPANDSRTNRRGRVLKTGRIWVDGDLTPFQCTVRDVSSEGARVKLSETDIVPDQFEFEIMHVHDNRVAEHVRRRVQVIWRSDRELGLRFTR